eukprot:TRINITY_DN852_c0_g1_i1.p1 TRINITY_DN852_c0_g1~~TRINITY_DN852_c0_g1_i1.p1  ORF type:complete len:210 (+),score=43.37 TRINITY_DN852_c0_g1_i1:38-631(+)
MGIFNSKKKGNQRGGGKGNGNVFKYKIPVVGNTSVGKSSIILRTVNDIFLDHDIATIGDEDTLIKTVTLPTGETIELQLCDTAGQEKFREITISYYRQARGVLVVYDVNDQSTVDDVSGWIADTLEFAPKPCAIFACGNKTDLGGENQDHVNSILDNEHVQQIFEVSAKTGNKIEDMFLCIAQNVHEMSLTARKSNC